jgi:hypothetical protein
MVACTTSAASALQLEKPIPFEIGGRVTYGVTVQRDAHEFPWNFASNAAGDHTRLMLDLKAGNGKMGELYLKGAALRETDEEVAGKKLFRFEQGDYFWQRKFTLSDLRLRIYANERRFFTHSLIAPLLDDDRHGDSGENIGARFDGSLINRFSITALYSALGHEFDRSGKIAYVKTAFAHDRFAISTSYVHENRPDENLLDQAIFKTELSAYYKKASMIVAYEQSGHGSGLFFPSASFQFDKFIGDNFSRVLPDEGALFAEARLAGMPVRQWGTVNLVHRYFALKRSFAGKYSEAGSGTAGYTTGAYFLANQISLNGRLVYNKSVRSRLEDETRENIEASAWARLKNDSELFLRCGIGEASGSLPFVAKENFIHGAWQYGKKRLRTGVHFMLKDLDTIFSERRFAWDSKLSFGGNMAIYWRAVIAHNAKPRDAIYARFEYRPSRRLFLTAGYGRSIFGDDPFLLEDADIQAMSEVTPQYAFTIRGDF